MFIKFTSAVKRDEAILKFNSLVNSPDDNQTTMREDLPIEVRALKNFLLGLKYLLKSWGMARTSLRADTKSTLVDTCCELRIRNKYLFRMKNPLQSAAVHDT